MVLGTMPNMYALVVGIDHYPDPIPTLEGCVNDANAFCGVLKDHYSLPAENVLTLLDAQATRAAVVNGFRQHLGKAKTDDIAIFFYAGHGSQEPTSSYYLPIEPDGKNETMVCYDSRSPGGYDLVDKDVAVLIQEIAANGARLTLVLDSCHAGSADRGLDDVGTPAAPAVRRAPDRTQGQPDSTYLRPPAEFAATLRNMDAAANTPAGGSQAQGFVQGAGGTHVLFAACSDFQNANEYRTITPPHGAFTWCLLQVLQQGKPLGNEELYERTRDQLRTLFPDQLPHLVVIGSDDLRATQFLGTAVAAGGNFFMARYDQGAWKLNGGSLQSLSAGDKLALYPADAAPIDLADPSKILTTATLLQLGPSDSTLTIADLSKVNQQQDYKAVATTRTGRVAIVLDGAAAGLAALRTGLAPSLYVQEGASPRFAVHAAADGYHIVVPADPKRPVPDPFPMTPQGVAATVAALEHMAQWTTRVELDNPNSKIPTDAADVAISYYDVTNKFQGQFVPPLDTLNLQYKVATPPTFRMRITNRGSSQLYFAVLACSGDWSISTSLLAEECTMLDTTQELFAAAGNEIPMQLKPGATEAHDHIVVIISTDWFDASAFALPNLTGPTVSTRDFGQPVPQAPPAPAGDFTTRHLEIVTRQQPPAVPAS